MEDLGAPVSYLTLEEGVSVLASDGRKVGTVAHVLADFQLDVFEGLIIRTGAVPPSYRFVDAEHVAELHERGVALAIDSQMVEELPRPSEDPVAASDEALPEKLGDRLRRAGDWISGKR